MWLRRSVPHPQSTVVSGTVGAVEQICQIWTDEGVMVRRVNTDVAFHSPAMDALTGRTRPTHRRTAATSARRNSFVYNGIGRSALDRTTRPELLGGQSA